MIKYLLELLPFRKSTFLWYRKTFFKESFGKNVSINLPVTFYTVKKGLISFGDNSTLGEYSNVRAVENPIKIGKDVLIAQLVSIISDNHEIRQKDTPIKKQGTSGGPVVIEDGAWIACNSVILPNVRVGKGAVVAAGSVVASDVPPFAVVAGNPARVVRYRKDE